MLRLSILFAALVYSLAAQNNPDAEELNTAVRMHQAGDYAGAIPAYQNFLRRHPEMGRVRSNLGAALAHEQRFDEAIGEYSMALDSDPGNVPVRMNLGLAWYKTGRMQEAFEQFEKVHQAEPENHQAILLLADVGLHLGENKKVIALVDEMGRIDNTDKAIAYLMGMALLRDGNHERAKFWLNDILKDSGSAEARILMASAKLMANDLTGATDDLAIAIQMNPALAEAHTEMGVARMRTGDSASAAREFRRALELDPNDFNACLQLAGLLRQDQSYADALAYLNRAIRLRPGDAGVRYQMAAIDLSESRAEKARATLEALVHDEPGFTEAHVSLATVYYRLKRKEDGDREREIVRKLNAETQQKQPGAQSQGSAAP